MCYGSFDVSHFRAMQRRIEASAPPARPAVTATRTTSGARPVEIRTPLGTLTFYERTVAPAARNDNVERIRRAIDGLVARGAGPALGINRQLVRAA